MIKPPTLLPVMDNSGAIIAGCINVPKLNSRIGAVPACLLTVSIKQNIFKKNIVKKSRIIIKGQIVKALLLTSKKGVKRIGNFCFRSTTNNVILMNQYLLPFGTRV